ncbi:MAG: hypothetical protein PGN07_07090 [Aeromicrobium erythreum]
MTETPGATPSDGPERPTGTARTLLLAAGAIVVVEALAYATLAVLDLADLTSGRAGVGVGVAVMLLGYAVALVVFTAKVLGGRLWARSPLVVAQLLQVLLAWNFRGDAWWAPLVLAGPALVCLACLLAPPVNRALAADAEHA